jgi:hypothetical protein
MPLQYDTNIPIPPAPKESYFKDMHIAWSLGNLTEQQATYACSKINRIYGKGASMRRRQPDRAYRVGNGK